MDGYPASSSTARIAPIGSSSARTPCNPGIVHTCAIAGGATSPLWTLDPANDGSVYTGLVSPIASTQLLTIAWLTGSRARRGAHGPAAAIFAAASSIVV